MNIPITHAMIWPFSSTGGYEWLIVLAVAVLLFGKRLPELGRLIGRTLVNFRHGVTEMKDEIARATDETAHPDPGATPKPPAPSATPSATPPVSSDPVIPTTDHVPGADAPQIPDDTPPQAPDTQPEPPSNKES